MRVSYFVRYDIAVPDLPAFLERYRKAHVPIGLVRSATRLLHRLPGFPITPDQLLMLEEDNVCDPQPFYSAFGLPPVPLAIGLRAMLG